VFPNVGFTIATINIGHALMSEGILWLGSVMTIMLVAIYLFVGASELSTKGTFCGLGKMRTMISENFGKEMSWIF
jgi:hypothetical protein